MALSSVASAVSAYRGRHLVKLQEAERLQSNLKPDDKLDTLHQIK
ncbi:hypothetical protein [Herminiimonas arsenitoxidans]|nr:hypothetical protein [Herminiimonas arsenitoxidans]